MTKKEYIEKAVSGIKNKTERREAEEELGAHLDELTELWTARGFEPSDAEQKAVGEMGAPEKTAEDLRKVHSYGRAASLAAAVVLLVIFSVTAAAVLFDSGLYLLSSSVTIIALIGEIFFFVVGGGTLLFGVKRRDPLLCAVSTIDSWIHIIFVFVQYAGYAGEFPVSPAVLLSAAAIGGNREALASLSAVVSVRVTSVAVCAVSTAFYALWLAASAAVTAAVVTARIRRAGKIMLKVKRIAARTIPLFCIFVLLADLPMVGRACSDAAASEIFNFDGWYLIPADAPCDDTLPADDASDLPGDAVYVRIDRFDDGSGFTVRPVTRQNREKSVPAEWGFNEYGSVSIPGLLEAYCFSAKCELRTEKRYLAAIPVKDHALLPDRAEFFELVPARPILLKTGESFVEKYWFLEIDMI
ncbi:MAG: hypothetical protein IJL26_13935 [Clostridia bacterium]|nr:hypothetical protein [Clostridia bacterium]